MGIANFNDYIIRRGKYDMCREIVEEIQIKRKEGHIYQIDEMKDLAEKFLKSVGYNGKGAVPIIKIAQKSGFKIIWAPMVDDEMSGFISVDKRAREKYGSDKIIGVNGNDELGHQRFVIAHELAHYLFDYDFKSRKPYGDTYIKNSHKSLKEKVANTFAANLLMPARPFVLKYDENRDMDRNIEDWAEYFEVQKKAVYKRIVEVTTYGI